MDTSAAHGVDVDEGGNGTVREQRLYQLARQPKPIVVRTFANDFLDAGVGGVRVDVRLTSSMRQVSVDFQRDSTAWHWLNRRPANRASTDGPIASVA